MTTAPKTAPARQAALPAPPADVVREFSPRLAEQIDRAVSLTGSEAIEGRRELTSACERERERALAGLEAAIVQAYDQVGPLLEQLEARFDRLSMLLGTRQWVVAPTARGFAQDRVTPGGGSWRSMTTGYPPAAQAVLRSLRHPQTGNLALSSIIDRWRPAPGRSGRARERAA